MDINKRDQPEDYSEETSAEHSDCSDSSDTSGIFGESGLLPRVGDEYQAVIPDLLTPSELHKYLSSHNNSELVIMDDSLVVRDNVDSSRTEPKHYVTKCSNANKESNIKGDCLDQRDDTWSEFEVDSFLLGLYIFGKNLLQVKRFMERKEMGQMLSFYYGKFYRTDKYLRWADCRKTKGRKCIIGQRLLTGSRQHELFSRLLPRHSEESRNISMEAYKAFADGRTSMEEYVSTLKKTVGIHALVEAVAIGKVNRDLTSMAMEPSRTSQVHPPSGKDYSSLTYEEIIKHLTGDVRLSKARSVDLFWDAVWPRLLAKGWHSEKPKDESFRRNCLVFLLPGIKKFKRKLLKGDHYFDSVCDVLKKVASDPEILLLEDEEIGTKNDQTGSDHDQNRYLKPRFSSRETNDMKFTIVDTGLLIEDEPSKIRELRSLPPHEKAADLSEKLRDLVGGGKKRTAKKSSDLSQKPVENHSDPLFADKHPVMKRRKLPATFKPVIESKSLDVGSCSSSAISSESSARSHLLTIDLNIALPFPDESNESSQNGSHDSSETVGGSANEGICLDEQANVNGRRQSTRIRPMSTRALEALETTLSKPKVGNKRETREVKPRTSRRVRLKNCTVDAVRDSETMRSNGICNASSDVLSQALI